MKLVFLRNSVLCLSIVVMAQTAAAYEGIIERIWQLSSTCDIEKLTDAEARGRAEWMMKCVHEDRESGGDGAFGGIRSIRGLLDMVYEFEEDAYGNLVRNHLGRPIRRNKARPTYYTFATQNLKFIWYAPVERNASCEVPEQFLPVVKCITN